jgi:hypothetical protein
MLTTCESLNGKPQNHKMSIIVGKKNVPTIEVETNITNIMGHDLAIIVLRNVFFIRSYEINTYVIHLLVLFEH